MATITDAVANQRTKTAQKMTTKAIAATLPDVYGENVGDKEISLSYADVYKLHAVYESGAIGTTAAAPTLTITDDTGTFTVGETVTGGTSAVTGEVARWDSATSYLYLINMTGTFTLTEIITGATSLATGTYATKITTDETTETLQTIDDSTSDKVSSTKQFEIDADSVFDFSETNPFGDNP